MKSRKRNRAVIPVDLESDSLTADLLDCIAGFPLFVDAMRNAEDGAEISMRLVDELLRRFSEADETRLDLSLVGSAAPDLLYIQIMGLICFDDWTLRYTRFAPRVLFDELRKRGVCSFYILDNAIRDDRFRALVEIFREAGFAVHSPNTSGANLAAVMDQIEASQILGSHILYVEPDATVNYLNTIMTIPKRPFYTTSFRNQAPSSGVIEILQLSKSRVSEILH